LTWGDSNVILPTIENTAMLEVYCVTELLYVVYLRMLANCCVWNYTPVKMHDLRIILQYEFLDLSILTQSMFTLCIPIMAAC